ncbi:MAG TPA: hypothetical protein VLB84_18325, partial [Bacteroidia bacterium]|nr:hypothetical protein [Bacteroidia bacterium]
PGGGQAAFNQWSKVTGNKQGLSFEDWLKPSQANWFKDRWAERRGFGQPPAPGSPETVQPAPPGGQPAQP